MSATPSTLTDPEQRIADLERQLAECKAERDEALERETATAEVLQVINSSPGDLAPVFDAMLDKAMLLCGASCGIICSFDGQLFHPGAARGRPDFLERQRRRGSFDATAGFTFARVVAGEQVVHIDDVTETSAYRESSDLKDLVEVAQVRSLLTVALRKETMLAGTISVFREEVRPFSLKQIALLQNFAAQAVIAMENTRLLTETREALEQQTATAEVLQVINSSPGDLAPVFQSILEKAHRLCDSAQGTLFLRERDDHFRPAAMRDVPPLMAEQLSRGFAGHDLFASQPLLAGEPLVHIHDLADMDLPMTRAAVRSGIRTLLSTPLRKDDALLAI